MINNKNDEVNSIPKPNSKIWTTNYQSIPIRNYLITENREIHTPPILSLNKTYLISQ